MTCCTNRFGWIIGSASAMEQYQQLLPKNSSFQQNLHKFHCFPTVWNPVSAIWVPTTSFLGCSWQPSGDNFLNKYMLPEEELYSKSFCAYARWWTINHSSISVTIPASLTVNSVRKSRIWNYQQYTLIIGWWTSHAYCVDWNHHITDSIFFKFKLQMLTIGGVDKTPGLSENKCAKMNNIQWNNLLNIFIDSFICFSFSMFC